MDNKFKMILFLSIFSLFSLHAKEVVFSLVPFGSSNVTTTMSFDWSEDFLTKTSSYEYNHNIARVACALASMSYLEYETMPDDNILKDAYMQLGVAENNIQFFYDVDFSDYKLGYDQCAFSIAHTDSVMFVNVRGVNCQNTYEWISCLNVSNETHTEQLFHEGFYKPMLELKKRIDEYIDKNSIDRSSIRILLTGHSRGASIVNLLAANYALENAQSDSIPLEHIFAYTFASPNTTTAQNAHDSEFGFIWNIVSAEDIVASVPFNYGEWNYTKYGNSLVLANSWNTDSQVYTEKYIPKINSFFTKIKKRTYHPLKTASFIPTRVTKIVSSVNKNVESYYESPISLYKVGKKFLEKTNPYDLMERDFSKGQGVIDKAALLATERTNGVVDVTAIIDSHTSETYLSHLMALDESEAYSSLGSSELILTGTQDGAVLDKDGNVVLTFKNGRVKHKSMKLPVIASDSGMKSIAIGLPANQEFTVVVAKDSIAPTVIKATIEKYGANGVLKERLQEKKLYPHKEKLYAIKAGSSTYNATEIYSYPLNGREKILLEEKSGLNVSSPLSLSLETNFDTNKNMGYGIHFGKPNSLYVSFLASTGLLNGDKIFDLQPGIGFGQTISGPLSFDIEAFAKCRFAFNGLDDIKEPISEKFTFIPSFRASFAVTPFHRLKIFAAGTLDFYTKNSGNEKLKPAVQIGLRF